MGKPSTQPRILGLVLIPAGYLLGIFNALPWPWKLRLWWIYLIRQCTLLVMSRVPLFLRYQHAQSRDQYFAEDHLRRRVYGHASGLDLARIVHECRVQDLIVAEDRGP